MRAQSERQVTWFRKFGGVCQSLIGEHVPPNMLSDAMNYEITAAGEMIPRNGAVRRFKDAAPDGLSVRSCISANMDGTVRDLVATDGHVYTFSQGSGWREIYTLPVASENAVTFALINSSVNPMVVFGNGAMPLHYWNGTAVIACQSLSNKSQEELMPVADSNAPAGRPVNYKGYLAVFGIPGNLGKVQFNFFLDGISSPDHWTDGGTTGTERFLEATGEITSVYPFAGLVIFTATRAQLFTGDPDAPVGVTDLSTTTGCVSHDSVSDCDGRLVWKSVTCLPFWTGGGTFPTDDLDVPNAPTKTNISKDMDAIEPANLSRICGTWIPDKKTYLFSADILRNGAVIRQSWIYSFKWQAWFPWSLAATALFVRTPIGRGQEVLVGTKDGAILTLDATTSHVGGGTSVRVEDDGRQYAAWAETGDQDMGYPDHEKVFRGFIIGCRGVGIRRFDVVFGGDFGISGHGATVTATIEGFFSMADKSHAAGTSRDNFDSGGLIVGNANHPYGRVGDVLVPSRPYMEERKPFVLRTKHLRIRFNNPIPDSGELKNIAVVPIAAYALEWKLGAIRRQLIGLKEPTLSIGDPLLITNGTPIEVIEATVGYKFPNTSSHTYYVYGYEWHVTDLVSGFNELVLKVSGIPAEDRAGKTTEHAPDGNANGLYYVFPNTGPWRITLTALGRWNNTSARNSSKSITKNIEVYAASAKVLSSITLNPTHITGPIIYEGGPSTPLFIPGTDVVVTAHYTDATTAVVTGVWPDWIRGTVIYPPTEIGDYTYGVSYTENGITKTATLTATLERILASISLSSSSEAVGTGETFDLSTITVEAQFYGDTPEVVTFAAVWSGTGVSGTTFTAPGTVGDVPLTCFYTENGVTKTVDVTMSVIPVLVSLRLQVPSTHVEYNSTFVTTYAWEEIDLSLIEVIGVYSDASEADISDIVTWSVDNFSWPEYPPVLTGSTLAEPAAFMTHDITCHSGSITKILHVTNGTYGNWNTIIPLQDKL